MHGFSSMRALLAGCVGAWVWLPSSFAADLGTFPSDDGDLMATLAVLEGEPPIEARKVTALKVLLASVSGDPVAPLPPFGPPAPEFVPAALTFDARMPEHDHGMPLKPVVTQTASGAFLVRGVKLPMAGTWEIVMTAKLTDGTRRIRIPVTL